MVDVYPNEYITNKIRFMNASANIAKIDTGPGNLCSVPEEKICMGPCLPALLNSRETGSLICGIQPVSPLCLEQNGW